MVQQGIQPFRGDTDRDDSNLALTFQSQCTTVVKDSTPGAIIVTPSEKLSDLHIEPPDDIERNIPDWVLQHNNTFQLDTKAVQMAC